jgi:uncharacterized protein (DUF697 family)
MIEYDRRVEASKIIGNIAQTAATLTAVFSQIPGMGVATLTKLYLEMATKIATLFGHKLEPQVAKSLVLDACNRYAADIFQKSVLGWIPLIGNIINAKITYDLTKNIGWFLYNHFEQTSD